MTVLKTTLTYLDDEGDEVLVTFPARYEVCGDCEGHGYVLNESMRGYAYTREEFEETFSDPDDRAQYFTRGGIYDVPCPTCSARRVVAVVDEARLNGAAIETHKRCIAYESELARSRAEDLRTMRLESGGRN